MALCMYEPGDFSFLKRPAWEEILKDMYLAVSRSNNWRNLKEFVRGPYFHPTPEWTDEINRFCRYQGHSGSSYQACFKDVHYIAMYGWSNYVLARTSSDPATRRALEIMELPYDIQVAKKEVDQWAKHLETATPANAEAIRKELERVQKEHRVLVEKLREYEETTPTAGPTPLMRVMTFAYDAPVDPLKE